jgi:1,4-dihydroxy-2-naphthoyl-CoA hydrolase
LSSKSTFRPDITPQLLNERGRGYLPALVGIEVLEVGAEGLKSRLIAKGELFAPNGFLHAAALVALADTTCGYGALAFLPDGAHNFTTIELTTNFIGAAREGIVICDAVPLSLGKHTQVWDAVVTAEGGARRLALFRCTQLVLY